MKLTKEDLMNFSKERIIEMFLEMQDEHSASNPNTAAPFIPDTGMIAPCWAPEGTCTNPYRDCILCPKSTFGAHGNWTTTISSDGSNLETKQFKNNGKETLND